MLMTKERRSAIRTLRGWEISVLQDAGAIRECEEHGCRTVPTLTRASGRSRSLARIRQRDSLRLRRSRKSRRYWPRSAIPAPNVRRTARGGAPTGGAKAVGLTSQPLLDPLSAVANLLDGLFDR